MKEDSVQILRNWTVQFLKIPVRESSKYEQSKNEDDEAEFHGKISWLEMKKLLSKFGKIVGFEKKDEIKIENLVPWIWGMCSDKNVGRKECQKHLPIQLN